MKISKTKEELASEVIRKLPSPSDLFWVGVQILAAALAEARFDPTPDPQPKTDMDNPEGEVQQEDSLNRVRTTKWGD